MKRLTQQHILTILLAVVVFAVPATVFAENNNNLGPFDSLLWSFIVGFFGTFAGWAGSLLNSAVNTFVIGFNSNQNIIQAIDILWVNMRDIFNLTFIFGLVYIGIRIILDSGNSNAKRWLVHIILAALLVNFSLFITKAIIDFSNIMATQIAKEGFTTKGDEVLISETFQQVIKTNQIWSKDLGDPGKLQDGGNYGYMFGTMLIYIVQVFAFGAGALILLIRFVMLCLFMILSPFMFLGWVFPQMEGMINKYWGDFLKRAFVAPLYILFLYFAAFILQSYYQTLTKLNYGKALNVDGGNAVQIHFEDTLPPFIIASIFLIAAVVVANKMGAEGASAAMSVGKNMAKKIRRGTTRAAGTMTAGMAAAGMRNTVGRGADALTRSNRFKQIAANSTLGKYAYKTAQKGAQSSFDVRQVGGLGKATGLGEGKKGGFAKSVADRNKADEKFLKDIHLNQDKTSPEFIAKAQKRASEIKNDAQSKIDNLSAREKFLLTSKDGELSEMVTNASQDSQRVEENLTYAQTARNDAEKAHHEAKERGDSAEDISELKKDLENKEKELEKSKLTKEHHDRRQTVIQNRQLSDEEKESRLESLDQEFTNEFSTAKEVTENKIKSLQDRVSRARTYAEAEVEYASELAYIKQLESSEKFWKRFGVTGLAALAGNQYAMTGAAAVGAAGTAGAVVAGSLGMVGGAAAAGAQATRARLSAENLKFQYGDSAMKMVKTKKQKDAFKQQAEAQKEVLGDDKTPEPTEPTNESES